MTILLLAVAALLAMAAFRRSPEGAFATADDTAIVKVRRSTSVVLALAESTWTILDALTLVTGRRTTPVVAGQRSPGQLVSRGSSPFGRTPADDVVAGE
jgi:hypothetical protein